MSEKVGNVQSFPGMLGRLLTGDVKAKFLKAQHPAAAKQRRGKHPATEKNDGLENILLSQNGTVCWESYNLDAVGVMSKAHHLLLSDHPLLLATCYPLPSSTSTSCYLLVLPSLLLLHKCTRFAGSSCFCQVPYHQRYDCFCYHLLVLTAPYVTCDTNHSMAYASFSKCLQAVFYQVPPGVWTLTISNVLQAVRVKKYRLGVVSIWYVLFCPPASKPSSLSLCLAVICHFAHLPYCTVP